MTHTERARPEGPLSVLIVDDEPHLLESATLILKMNGIPDVVTCNDSRNVLPLLEQCNVAVLVLDISMPHLSGDDLMETVARDHPDVPIIIMTGNDRVETAVRFMKSGAFDYMVKPVEENRFVSGIKRAMELRELHRENILLKENLFSARLETPSAFKELVTASPVMRSVFQYAEMIAVTDRPVLVTGETGVGKELLARAIHRISNKKGALVPVNAAGLDDTVFSDALFGHKKGAFTGADEQRSGLLESAADGTLFLDEIGDLTPASQVKLLRLLQSGEYYPLGSDTARKSNARIIVATHNDLPRLIEEGMFRKDLFYRLKTHEIHIPPLRERLEDIPLLVDHFLEEGASALGKKKPTPPKELCTFLSAYHFPGNVRELQSILFDAVSRHVSKVLSMDSIRQSIGSGKSGSGKGHGAPATSPDNHTALCIYEDADRRFPTLKQGELFLVAEALKRTQNNQSAAAELLGITRSALNKRLNRNKTS